MNQPKSIRIFQKWVLSPGNSVTEKKPSKQRSSQFLPTTLRLFLGYTGRECPVAHRPDHVLTDPERYDGLFISEDFGIAVQSVDALFKPSVPKNESLVSRKRKALTRQIKMSHTITVLAAVLAARSQDRPEAARLQNVQVPIYGPGVLQRSTPEQY
jgi:hypothetical protein